MSLSIKQTRNQNLKPLKIAPKISGLNKKMILLKKISNKKSLFQNQIFSWLPGVINLNFPSPEPPYDLISI